MQHGEFLQFFSENVTFPKTGDLSMETPLDDLQQWDSLTILITISAIEEANRVVLTGPQLRSCSTVGDIYQLLDQ
jgi:acyl carrier protein